MKTRDLITLLGLTLAVAACDGDKGKDTAGVDASGSQQAATIHSQSTDSKANSGQTEVASETAGNSHDGHAHDGHAHDGHAHDGHAHDGQAHDGPSTPAPPGSPSPVQVNPDASIFSPDPEVDFGELLQGEKRSHTFKVGNKGSDAVIIRSVNPTCGCTIAEVRTPAGDVVDPKQHNPNTDMLTLQPGEECDVSVEFNSQGQPTRALQKHIMVISTDDKNPALRLTIKAVVSTGIELSPNPLQFGEVTRGEKVTKRLLAKLKTIKDLNITEFEALPEYVEVSWDRIQADDGSDAIAVDVTLLPSAPIGYVAPTITAKTNSDRIKQIQMQLYAHVKSEVVFDTGNKINKERIDFEVIPFGESRTRTLEIVNHNPAVPYTIKDVSIDSIHKDLITMKVETLEEGSHYKITLVTDPALDARFFRGKVIVNSAYHEMPAKEIFFHGWVKKT